MIVGHSKLANYCLQHQSEVEELKKMAKLTYKPNCLLAALHVADCLDLMGSTHIELSFFIGRRSKNKDDCIYDLSTADLRVSARTSQDTYIVHKTNMQRFDLNCFFQYSMQNPTQSFEYVVKLQLTEAISELNKRDCDYLKLLNFLDITIKNVTCCSDV